MVRAIPALPVNMVQLLEFARTVQPGLTVTKSVHYNVANVPWARPRPQMDYRNAQFVLLAISVTKVFLLATVGAIPVLSVPLATQPALIGVTNVPWARHRVPLDR